MASALFREDRRTMRDITVKRWIKDAFKWFFKTRKTFLPSVRVWKLKQKERKTKSFNRNIFAWIRKKFNDIKIWYLSIYLPNIKQKTLIEIKTENLIMLILCVCSWRVSLESFVSIKSGTFSYRKQQQPKHAIAQSWLGNKKFRNVCTRREPSCSCYKADAIFSS